MEREEDLFSFFDLHLPRRKIKTERHFPFGLSFSSSHILFLMFQLLTSFFFSNRWSFLELRCESSAPRSFRTSFTDITVLLVKLTDVLQELNIEKRHLWQITHSSTHKYSQHKVGQRWEWRAHISPPSVWLRECAVSSLQRSGFNCLLEPIQQSCARARPRACADCFRVWPFIHDA